MDLPEGDVGNLEEVKEDEHEEEDDVDFNPFLIAETPSEPSSSLSCDDDVLGNVTDDKLECSSDDRLNDTPLVESDVSLNCVQDSNIQSGEDADFIQHLLEETSGKDSNPESSNKTKKTISDNGQTRLENDERDEIENTVNKDFLGKTTNSDDAQNLFTELDTEGAICNRTRARHSLQDYTLEELEAFLQESDDDDFIQINDDKEEYCKFLASVFLEGDNALKEVGQVDIGADEDEENDVDFEVEIQEALESDADDDNVEFSEHLKRDLDGKFHRPQTRQKIQQRNQKKPAEPSKVPLRPILPSTPNVQQVALPFSQFGCHLPYPTDLSHSAIVHGFTAQQIGQLYCLLHEHIQLLIQVFSQCVVDPSRQHIAIDVQKMIFEMVDKREEALSMRKMPYPPSCFHNLHVHQSQYSDNHKISGEFSWMPSVRNSILSVLDVATLSMAREFMTDVNAAVVKHQGSHVGSVLDKSHMTKVPLFPLSSCIPVGEMNNEAISSVASCQSSIQGKPKKSLAATLVEHTKKQSIAHVPKGIADLAQRFVPLFNSELFPHKPPLPANVNRVLFTESEDRLLAMGLMECNTDWVAIQKRFLPCKSKHQIFIRQKNRSSSKSPENPIKTVRHVKTSPLTVSEVALISKGLKLFKNDLNAVWRFFVPYRDPSLLPRQWRIATGTQKSYRKSEALKEKRRAYEANRRKRKAGQQLAWEKEVDDSQNYMNNMDEDDEPYVHEAFLAEPEPGGSKLMQTQTNQDVLSYQMHKASATKVVKLAPGLPPVNLPSSVRIISQSAFKNHCGLSSYSIVGDRGSKLLPSLYNTDKPGGTLINSRNLENIYSDKNPEDCLQNPSSGVDHYSTEENCLGSDVHMHPLLFRPSENVHQSHYKETCSVSALKTSNFSSGHPPLKDGHNFIGPQHGDGNTEFSYPTKHSKELLPSMHTIDFHPLLQRTESRTEVSVDDSEVNLASGRLQPFVANCALTSYAINGVSSEPHTNLEHTVPSTASTSHYEDENELDLNIHLTPPTKKRNKANSPMNTIHSVASGNASPLDDPLDDPLDGPRDGTMSIGNIQAQPPGLHENRLEATVANLSSVHTVKSCNRAQHNSRAYVGHSYEGMENAEDEHLTGIVMEQEELSDSDEENEHIEFEREEMDDSEGEQCDD